MAWQDRESVLQRMEEVLNGIVYSRVESVGTVVPFGSWVAGLHTPAGDVDLSLEGTLSWRAGLFGQHSTGDAKYLTKAEKIDVLKACCRALPQYVMRRLLSEGIPRGRVECVWTARIPIIKFTDAETGLHVDLSVDGRAPLFRSTLLGQLQRLDWRVGALVRLVKQWASAVGISGAADGMLSSHALTLMVIWHLQMRVPAVLPPVGESFDSRPLEAGADPDMPLVQQSCRRLYSMRTLGTFSCVNGETLAELLFSFFSAWRGLLEAWLEDESGQARFVRASIWHGGLCMDDGWRGRGYLFAIEEPTDAMDNVARSVRSVQAARRIAAAFRQADHCMTQEACDQQGVAEALRQLFGEDACRSSGALGELESGTKPPVRMGSVFLTHGMVSKLSRVSMPESAVVGHTRRR
ncbi:hypothetical protein ABPG75_003274 [Micractinium tetrahymenae]